MMALPEKLMLFFFAVSKVPLIPSDIACQVSEYNLRNILFLG